MRRRVLWIGGLAMLVVCAMAVASLVVRQKTVEEYSTLVTPLYVETLGSGGDPRTIAVVFPWHESGFCVGQFLITARETPTEVIVNQVMARHTANDEVCAGVGSNGETAGDYLELSEPLGTRIVARAQDGKQHEVRQQ